MDSVTRNNTPALRFDGFDGEWVDTTFGETARLCRGLTYSPQDIVNPNEGVRVYRSSNIQNSSVITNPDDVWVSHKAVNIPLLAGGDILITASNGSVRLVGKNGIVKKLAAPGVPGGFMLKCVSALPAFTAALLQSPWYMDFLNIHVAGGNGAIGNLDSNRLSGEVVSIPPKPEEQRFIGELFSDLDALIEQHRAKHANLQQTKTALLQRMFPQDGADEPEVRLCGFEGVWSYTRLADIAQMYQPQTIASKELQQSGVPVFGANGFIGFYNAANHTTDQVTISARGEKTGTPSYVSGPVWITGNSMVVNVDSSGIDKRFLYGNLSSRSLKSLVTGGAQPQLTRNVLNEYRISIPPTLEEQRAIGDVFSNLDALIADESRYITQLTQAKTALLQRMFV